MRRDSSFCAKSVRYNIFTNGAPYSSAFSARVMPMQTTCDLAVFMWTAWINLAANVLILQTTAMSKVFVLLLWIANGLTILFSHYMP